VSGTTPLPQCTQLIRDTAPGAQAAIFGSQSVATTSNTVVMERLTELRNQQAQGGTQATAYADALAFYTKAPVADPISGRLVTPNPVRSAFWLRGYGDFENRDVSTNTNVAGATITFEDRFRQRSGGVMGGGDLIFKGITSANDAFILGALAGYTSARVTVFNGRHELSGAMAGIYSTYVNGNFFLDNTFKVDFLEFDTNIATLPSTADVRNYSFLANIGYKFDLQRNWYIEPTVGFEYVRTEFSNQSALATTIAQLEDASLLRGRFGARIGTSWVDNNWRIEPSLLALGYYYFEATGASIQLGAAGGTIILPTDEGKFRGELQGSVNFFNLSTGVSGFVRGDLRLGDDVVGGGFRTGIRFQN
jgi:outer membrane autotransporter protein